MEPGQGYKGHSALIENHRLHQAEDLFIMNDPEAGLSYDYEDARNKAIKPAIDAIKDVKNKIDMSYTHPRFHIIRTPTGSKAETVIGRIKTICGDEYAYKKCYAGEEQLMDRLAIRRSTFLFIKEKARCAVTFVHKDLIGILYERLPKSPKTDVIVQGLAEERVDTTWMTASSCLRTLIVSNAMLRCWLWFQGPRGLHLHR